MYRLRIFVEAVFVLCTTYAVSFVCIFYMMIEGDLTLLKSYFIWGWTGGGELPLFITIVSTFISIIATFIFFKYRFNKYTTN